MRLLLLTLALLIAFPVSAQEGQWEWLQNAPTTIARIDDIAAVTPELLFVVSDQVLYKSADGGDSWSQLGMLEGAVMRSLAFPSEEVGWVGTIQGENVLFETRDGGETIVPISDRIGGSTTPLGICGMHAVDDEVVYAVGAIVGGAHFTRTLDGGQTWEATDMSDRATFLIDVHFFDRAHGFVVGGIEGTPFAGSRVTILATEDGGDTWEERFRSDFYGWGWKISFPTPQTGYVSVQRRERVVRTEDGGETWVGVPAPLDDMQGLGFVTPSVGWIGGNGTPRVTTDGGQTWSIAPVLDSNMNRFRFFGDSLGFAVGSRVYRYHAGNAVDEEAEPVALPEALSVLPAYPNPFPERVLVPYRLPKPAAVTFEAFDLTGRRVGLVEHGLRSEGPGEILWWARDEAGRALPAGVYLYRLRAGDQEATGRVVKAGH